MYGKGKVEAKEAYCALKNGKKRVLFHLLKGSGKGRAHFLSKYRGKKKRPLNSGRDMEILSSLL